MALKASIKPFEVPQKIVEIELSEMYGAERGNIDRIPELFNKGTHLQTEKYLLKYIYIYIYIYFCSGTLTLMLKMNQKHGVSWWTRKFNERCMLKISKDKM